MIPVNITPESIAWAIVQINISGVPPSRQARFYDHVVNGAKYPPKYTLCVASKFANGKEASYDAFNAVEAVSYFIGNSYHIQDRRLIDGKTQDARMGF